MSDDGQGQGDKPAGTFTQTDVDRIVGERLAKARKAAETELAQLREQVAQLTQAHEEATGKLSEGEKIARKLAEVDKARAKAEAERDAERQQHHRTRVGYQAARLVGSLDLRDPASAKVLLRDLEGRLRVGEAGAVELVGDNGEGAALDDKAFASFAATEYGWALKAAAGSGSPHGAGKAPPKAGTGPLRIEPGAADRLFEEGFAERNG